MRTLYTTVQLNGHPFHADAWPTKHGSDPQELDGLYPDDLDALTHIYDPAGHFNTVKVRGRDCIIVIFPFA